jgi:hypothetical protein
MTSCVLYADEAWTHDEGLRHWRFYGGALLQASRDHEITSALNGKKTDLGLEGELAWTNVRPFNWERVAQVMYLFLEYVDARAVKLRYLWIDQQFQNPNRLTEYHKEYGYYILYYFFVVYGFGLPWHGRPDTISIQFRPDRLPDEPEKRRSFETFLLTCHNNSPFRNSSAFKIANVGSVDSKKHVILQCVDVVIGSMGWRLTVFMSE